MTEFLLLVIAAGIGVLIFRKPGSQFEFPVRMERVQRPQRPSEIVPTSAPPVSHVFPVSPQVVTPTATAAGSPPNKAAAVILMVLAILYAVFPLDPIPDFIPVLGWIDDIAILMAARKNLSNAMKTPEIEA